MAEEIALYKKVIVRRPNRDFLLRIRKGEFSYEDLVSLSTEKISHIDQLYEKSDLPEKPVYTEINKLLIQMRELLYEE